MKKNKSKAFKKFQREIELNLAQYYSDALSANIKRGLENKRKTLKKEKLQCKAK